jgi:hypothetical protein
MKALRVAVLVLLATAVARSETTNTTAGASPTNALPQQGSLDYLDAKYGFMDVTFGQTLQDVKRVVESNPNKPKHERFACEDEGDGITTCTRSGGGQKLGNYEIWKREYHFLNGRLYQVDVFCFVNAPSLVLPVFELAYGKAEVNPIDDRIYQWAGKKVFAMLFAVHDLSGSPITVFRIQGRELTAQVRKLKEKRDAEAAKGL